MGLRNFSESYDQVSLGNNCKRGIQSKTWSAANPLLWVMNWCWLFLISSRNIQAHRERCPEATRPLISSGLRPVL